MAPRPALSLAAERLQSGLSHLVNGIRWAHDALPGDEIHDAVHYSFVCSLQCLEQAADIADLIPTCLRCERAPATDGEYCAPCHDALGERQDARAAS